MMINRFAESSKILGENSVILTAREKSLAPVNRLLWIVLALFTLLSLSCASAVYSAAPQIQNVLIQREPRCITVYAKVSNGFNEEIDSAILAGMPVTFTFYVDFYQRRSFWFDKKLSSRAVNHTIKFDQVKNTYFVSLNHGQEPFSYQDLRAAKEAMTDLHGLEIMPVADLKKDEAYYVEIKAMLKKMRLPLHMEYVFFFVSLWDWDTNLIREEFRY